MQLPLFRGCLHGNVESKFSIEFFHSCLVRAAVVRYRADVGGDAGAGLDVFPLPRARGEVEDGVVVADDGH